MTSTNPATASPFANNWHLTKTQYLKSIYNTKNNTIQESADVAKILSFIKNKQGIDFSDKHPQKEHFSNELDFMTRYQSTYNASTDSFISKLSFPKHKWGRAIPVESISLSMMHRPTRHALAKDSYIDIDMVNASQRILLEICKLNSINVPHIEDYCNNREEYLNSLITQYEIDRDSAKKLILALSFGGGYTKWENDLRFNKFIKHLMTANNWTKEKAIEYNSTLTPGVYDGYLSELGFKKDRVKCVSDLANDYELVMDIVWGSNQQIIKDVLAVNPSKFLQYTTEAGVLSAKKRTCLSLFYQTVERHIQESMIIHLVETRQFALNKIIPCQDGFMIKNDLFYEGMMQELEDVQMQRWGFVIPIILKGFDEAIDIPISVDMTINWVEVLSLKGIAEHLVKLYPNEIMYENKRFYLFYEKRWYEGEEADRRITRLISDDVYKSLKLLITGNCVGHDKTNHLETLRGLTGGRASDTASIKGHLVSLIKPLEIPFNSKPFLLGFTNGVLDLSMIAEKNEEGVAVYSHEDCFRPYRYDDYMTIHTGYDFEPFDVSTGEDVIEDIVEFFQSVMPKEEHRALLFQTLASCLDGLLYQRFIMFNGGGGNGKGSIFELMDTLLGAYFRKAQNELLKGFGKANQASEDMMDLRGVRMLVFEEIGDVIDNNIMKRLTGGGKLTGRRLYGGNETFELNASIFASFNQKPELKHKPEGNSELRRLIDLFFSRNFTDTPSKVGKREVVGDTEILWCVANPKYTTKEWALKIRSGMLNMLLNVYNKYSKGTVGITFDIPEDLQRRVEEFLDAQNIFNSIFSDRYIKDADNNKTVKVKDIWDTITSDAQYRALSFADKRTYNRKYFDEWLSKKAEISADKNKVKILVGYTEKHDDDDDEGKESGAEIKSVTTEIIR